MEKIRKAFSAVSGNMYPLGTVLVLSWLSYRTISLFWEFTYILFGAVTRGLEFSEAGINLLFFAFFLPLAELVVGIFLYKALLQHRKAEHMLPLWWAAVVAVQVLGSFFSAPSSAYGVLYALFTLGATYLVWRYLSKDK